MMGWQFDSGVQLVRGADVRREGPEAALLPFLASLLARKKNLQIRILAWDHSLVFLLERESRQADIFNAVSDRLEFRFDNELSHGASLHQKLVVIDGRLAFSGGMDNCDARWDDRDHLVTNPYRVNLGGDPVGPYHDVQMFYEGEVAERLAAIFCARWEVAGGAPIAPLPSAANHSFDLRASVDVHTPQVAIARTVSRTGAETAPPTYEIHALYTDAIAAAEGLIYIETQYLTSRAICQALEARMSEPRRSKLQIVIVLPKHAEALKEEVALGVKQTERLRSLAETARRTGHALGVYYTVAAGGEVPIYIHSKLLVIDDRFMTVGSANCTNRSLSLDHELNLAWESTRAGDEVFASILASRVALLSEHCGQAARGPGALEVYDGLVERLDGFAANASGCLRIHPLESTALRGHELLSFIAAQDWGLDPDLTSDALE